MNSSFMNKIITTANGKQYVVIDENVYQNKMYVIANEVVNNDLNEMIYIFRVDMQGDKVTFAVEENTEVLKAILDMASNKQ